ncbi:hypothetical protein TELCIR_04500 [Teladorsagia circumcincta]|uniref:Cytochrome c oxidase polypeptide II n=1 Tax=Teladorsagia circumcincta TaxID=45464 RepID=A0A2G9UTF6_TELCI|nr:hypothetical protein TELCIR_04500 [Teladorsagia circumcincta]
MTHLWKVFTSKQPCDVMVTTMYCYVMRLITSCSYTAHTTVLFGLLLERVIATRLVATYDKCTAVIGCVLLSLVLGFAVVLCIVKQHRYCMEEQAVYCSSLTAETFDDVLLVHILLFLMLIIALAVFGMLFFLNMKIRKRISHDVSKKYQASENLQALRVLRPMLILHFIGYPLYFVISLVFQGLKKILGSLIFRVLYSAIYVSVHRFD